MSAATASVADVSRTDRDDARQRNNSGRSQSPQCAPMPLPALGTQKIVQGNGTTVGTVIALQCPAKHKLIGKQLKCVMDNNSTHWEGKTFCQPLTPYEDYGFRVAVVASIVSSAIILLMSMAFITCCWVDCIKREEKKKQESRESNMCHIEEQVQHRDNNWSQFSHKSRNNNNNNTQEKTMLSLWDAHYPPVCDNRQTCRCHQEFSHRLVHSYSPATAPLPGHDYEQPLITAQNPPPPPPQYPGPNLSAYQSASSPSLVQISATGPALVWQYDRQHTAEDVRSSHHAKEFSIRIISV